ncbi:hypothetical protein F4815DRAFT_491541 [Daldinia loculata]|nr:hypothetical protein F4815DRAFT_491541 [Daldinia loculata]
MKRFSLTTLALFAPSHALIRFPCAQLVVERLDPLVNPGLIPSPHLHQIVGGARNGTYKRDPQMANSGFDCVNAGMTVYYMQDDLYNFQQTSKVTAFQPGFRMYIGNVNARSREDMERFRQLTYTCLQDINTRDPQILDFPKEPCPYGIMTALRFPTSVHSSPASHPVRMNQLFYEVNWDTRQFNNKEDWPEDGSQPFVWSFGDLTGYGNHGDYVFGWQDDALQRALDQPCYINCPTLKTQNAQAMNACSKERVVTEDNIDDWVETLPGGMVAGM